MKKIANILVIDDDRVLLRLCTHILEKEGYTIKGALNGKIGLELFNREFLSSRHVISSFILNSVRSIHAPHRTGLVIFPHPALQFTSPYT